MSEPIFTVAVRADASHQIGTGHVMRCLTLARNLKAFGAEVVFVCRAFDGHLMRQVEMVGFEVLSLAEPASDFSTNVGPAHASWLGVDWREDSDETLSALAGRTVDWLVVDHYGLDYRWQQRMRVLARNILVVDDLADRQHDSDVLLDQNYFEDGANRYADLISPNSTALLGPKYALLGSDYPELRRRASPRSGVPRRILVSFGGADQLGLTLRAVKALLTIEKGTIQADIVLPQASRDFSTIEGMLEDNCDLVLHDRVPSLAPLILSADLAIGAGGSTHWERMCLGLPTLVVTMADNQTEIARQLSQSGLIEWLGDAESVTANDIAVAVTALLEQGLAQRWSEACMKLVDGRGGQRVAAVLATGAGAALNVRHAELQDEDLLLGWANDPVTRANGYNPNFIPREDHVRWFRSRLRQPKSCRFFIVELAGIPLGQVRFDDRGGEWEISYAVAPEFRGRRIGRKMLEIAIAKLDQQSDTIIGQVKPGNVPSRRLLESLGFSLRSNDPERLVYERHSHT